MKIKFKVFVKKIKNWLSSLSKWAQKHKLKLFVFVFSMVLFVSSILACNCNKVARASTVRASTVSSLVSDRSMVNLPSTPIKFQNVDNTYYVCNSYLAYYEGGLQLYLVQTDNNQVDSYYYSRFPLYSNTTTYCPAMYVELEESNAYYYYLSRPSVDNTSRMGRMQITFLNNYTNYNDIISNSVTTRVSYVANTSTLTYSFIDIDSNVVCNIDFLYLYTFADSSSITMPTTFCSTTVVADSSLNIAFADGYNSGYLNGYNAGLEATWSDLSPLGVLSSSVDDLFTIELFGDITLGSIIRIGFAIILLGFLIKIFFGG